MPDNLIVVDASVVIKWFHEEEGTKAAEKLQQQIAKGELRAIVPPLLFYEVANVLTVKADSEIEQVVETLKVLENLPFQVVEVSPMVLEEAIRLAHQNHISVYDAIYVALAILSEARLVTADVKLMKAIGSPVELLGKH
jgi:predicted nucleic acid-binding protein